MDRQRDTVRQRNHVPPLADVTVFRRRLPGVGAVVPALCCAVLLLAGCHTPACVDRCQVDADLTHRMGESLGPWREADETLVPPHVDLADGVTEDEAVAVALWNNAAFQELLSQLGISRAQLLDAGLLPDPEMTIFFPLGPKQLEFTIYQSASALWLRPVRQRAAEMDLLQVAEQMVQNGLNVIRDVRSAHAALVLAQSQSQLAAEALELQTAIAELAGKRLAAGAISELETINSQIDAQQAQADADRFRQEVTLARERLRVLMGITLYDDPLVATAPNLPTSPAEAVENYVSEALAMRPDLRAAELAVEAACQRSELAHLRFMNLDAIYDANGRGFDGFESGPGFRLSIPLFNRNEGGIAIADALVEQALRRYVTVRDQVTLDVRTSHAQCLQAQENLQTVQRSILPSLETSVRLARQSFLDGASDYVLVLLTTRRYIDARTRELQLRADVQRAQAELERSVGHRIVWNSTEESGSDGVPAPLPPAPATVPAVQSVDATTSVVIPASHRRSRNSEHGARKSELDALLYE